MGMQRYEPAMRQEARRLIAEHGDLVEVRCLSGAPPIGSSYPRNVMCHFGRKRKEYQNGLPR